MSDSNLFHEVIHNNLSAGLQPDTAAHKLLSEAFGRPEPDSGDDFWTKFRDRISENAKKQDEFQSKIFGEEIKAELKDKGLRSIHVERDDDWLDVKMKFDDDFVWDMDDKTLTGINIDENVSFSMTKLKDGSIKIVAINGIEPEIEIPGPNPSVELDSILIEPDGTATVKGEASWGIFYSRKFNESTYMGKDFYSKLNKVYENMNKAS